MPAGSSDHGMGLTQSAHAITEAATLGLHLVASIRVADLSKSSTIEALLLACNTEAESEPTGANGEATARAGSLPNSSNSRSGVEE